MCNYRPEGAKPPTGKVLLPLQADWRSNRHSGMQNKGATGKQPARRHAPKKGAAALRSIGTFRQNEGERTRVLFQNKKKCFIIRRLQTTGYPMGRCDNRVGVCTNLLYMHIQIVKMLHIENRMEQEEKPRNNKLYNFAQNFQLLRL